MSMPNLALPSVVASGAPRTQASPGARQTESSDARGFEQALEASRGSRKAAATESTGAADASATNETGGVSSRKGSRGDDRKGSTLTPAEVMAMLAPFQPLAQARSDSAALANGHAAEARGAAGAAVAGAAAPDLAAQATPTAGTDIAADADNAATATDSSGQTADKAAGADKAALAAAADAASTKANATPADDATTLADAAVALAAAKAVPGVVADAAPGSARPTAKARVGDATSATASAARSDDADGTSAASGAGNGAAIEFEAALAAVNAGASSAGDGDASAREGEDPRAAQPLPFQAGVASTSGAADRAAAIAAATSTHTVAPEVGHEAWAAALAQQMLRMSTSGQHVARLNLNPAELGPLQVTLSMNDQQTQAMFMSSHEGVRKALEAALPQLRSTLAAQGIELGQASVQSGSSQQFGGQGGQGGYFAGQDSPRPRAQADYPGAAPRAEAQAVQTTAPAQRSRAQTGLDTFA
ncbi:flagellar hook-length control protein FliK [Variovorax dokdonensis]|uniref:Flagellar hook-length control protein FliK n=1 Tax=Variovorax dokdonensis TaxID=344883 RepID=A0ABT7N4U9_9BURK|nr:flagellar hook-length control protein FliK [Variovorax dokdonensis]MDM0042961.1 flagellar hook-length control protein FliK [Variovorax dokdonensis]